jgi:hypothetical protein
MASEVFSIEPVRSESDTRCTLGVMVAYLLTGAGVVSVFFREFITSHFNRIAGNVGDNRFLIVILEHWLAVLHGQAPFRSPNFFWPQPDLLGFSEAIFLYAVPYMFLRSLGVDQYLSFEMVLIGLKILGFFGMVWLLRSFMRLSTPVVLLGATLFTISNIYYISIGHSQLISVGFVPLLCCLGLRYWQECKAGRVGRGNRYLFFAAGLLGLVFFTSYYIAWFTVFGLVVITLTGLVGRLIVRRNLPSTRQPVGVPKVLSAEQLPGLAVAGLIFVSMLIPFFMTYLPALRTTGGRPYSEAVLYQWEAMDVINVGPSNWVWGKPLEPLITKLRTRPGAGEKERGWPPVILVVCIGTTAWALVKVIRPLRKKSGLVDSQWVNAALLGTSTGILWLVSIQFRGHSLWWLVFHFFPGGAAIRAPSRIVHLLNIGVVIVVCLAVEKFAAKTAKRMKWAVVGLCGMALVCEQINTGRFHEVDRSQEMASIALIPAPLVDCKAFLATVPLSVDRPSYAHQIDAMLIARKYGVPTINGYSGWFPAGWDFFNLDTEYLSRAEHWARMKGVTDGLCGANLRTGEWSHINLTDQLAYEPGSLIDFHSGGNSLGFEGEGWGTNEAGGTWTVGSRSVLFLNLTAVPQSDLILDLEAHAFTPSQRRQFEETLLVNGTHVTDWKITEGESLIKRRVQVPRELVNGGSMRLEFVNHDPRSPADLGLSTDTRKIGLAIHTLRLRSSNRSHYEVGEPIDFRTGGNSTDFEGEGWAANEAGGTWTVGRRSVLLLNLSAVPKTELVLDLEAHAFTPPQKPAFTETVLINGTRVAEWKISDEENPLRRRARIAPSLIKEPLVRLELINHDPRSPADLGVSSDSRKIALALHTLRLQRAASVAKYTVGQTIDFRTGGNSVDFVGEGWGAPEAGGTWTLGDHSPLDLNLGTVPKTDLLLQIEAHAFTPSERPEFVGTIMVNGAQLAEWHINSNEALVQRQFRLPRSILSSPVIHIEFLSRDPRSPADFGISTDRREIGLAMHSLMLSTTPRKQ